MTPLKDALKAVVDELLEMNKKGPLRCKYIIEKNDELVAKTFTLIKEDVTVQWLAGDELKRD